MLVVSETHPVTVAAAFSKYLTFEHGKASKNRKTLLESYSGEGIEGEVRSWFADSTLNYSPVMQQNITRKIINARYIAYKQAPQRLADETYMEKLGSIDAIMVQLERLTGVLGTTALQRWYNEEKEELESNILIDFLPVFLPESTEPVAVLYPISGHYSRPEDQSWVYWSDEYHCRITRKGDVYCVGDNVDMVNPYGIMPVNFSHLTPQLGCSWYRRGSEDIANAQLLYNVFGTQLALGCLYQALGQPMVSGVDDIRKMQVGVDKIIALPEGGRFEFVSPSGSLSEIRESQRWVVDTVAFSHHLKIKWAETGGSTSGEHQRILEVELTEAIQSDFNRWRSFEQERFNVDRAILQSAGVNIGDTYSVDFSEPHIPLSPDQERAEWEWKWQHGLATKADWFRLNNPDMAEEEVTQKLSEVQAEKQAEKPSRGLLEALSG